VFVVMVMVGLFMLMAIRDVLMGRLCQPGFFIFFKSSDGGLFWGQV